MAWRFSRRVSILPGVSLNIGKRGASVSVGPRGAKLTVGPRGAHITAGIPGTGFHITEKLQASCRLGEAIGEDRAAWRQAFVDHFVTCIQNPHVTIAEMRAALDYRHTLKLTDDELGPRLLDAIAKIQGRIMAVEAAGHSRLWGDVPTHTPSPDTPSSPHDPDRQGWSSRLKWAIGALIVGWLGLMAVALLVQPSRSTPARVSAPVVTATPPAVRPRGYVSRADFGAKWPLTVEDGMLSCVNSAVTFSHAGNTYAVNGRAKGLKRYRPIEPIWRTQQSPLPPRVDIGPLIERGLALCRK
jgi:hypothetical protein